MADPLIFMTLPPPDVLSALRDVVDRNGLRSLLGGRLFAEQNWHQSLSDRYDDGPEMRERLLRLGERASKSATAFALTVNRIRDRASMDPVHWAFQILGRPKGFDALLDAIRAALSAEGLTSGPGHTPHLTISYNAGQRLPPIQMSPVVWTIDRFMLVVGRGRPYRYEVLQTWPLLDLKIDAPARQMDLF